MPASACLVMTPQILTALKTLQLFPPKFWNELAEFPGAINRSTFDEFVSADDDVSIMGQLQDKDYIADVVPTTSQSDSNMEIDDGQFPTSSEVWGLSRGLKGQIGSLCLFSEPLQASQVKMMYTGGPRNYTLFKNEDSVEVAELLGKLVLYYDAKASVDGTCTNLAPSSSIYDGTFTGRYCHTQNVKVPGHCIDVNVLMAVQLLVENASGVENAQEMLQLVYQHILFDFRIWSKGSFAVRLGHIQYLTTIIKEDRKYFRKKYGPRFMLDMVQMFYSDCSLLTSDDVKTIRMAVLSLVKFYMMRDVSIQDVNAVVSYMLSQRKEELAKEMIEILLHLLESPSTKDQLVLLLYEPNCAELFYCILLNREFSSCTKVKVLKVIQALLRSDRVYEKSKSRLRLAEVGFSSLTGLLSPNEVTSEVARELVNLILMSDISQAFPGFLAVLNLIKNMDIELKFYAAKKLLAVLTDSAVLLPQLAAQAGWQECVLSLLIKEPISESNCANRATMPTLDLIDLNSLEADTSADSEKPGSPVLKRGTLHRLSQKALVAQQSLEEILPGSPKASQIFTHLKEHIFDFEISQLLGSARSRTNSQCSSQEDLASDATQQSSPVSVTPSSLRKAPDQSPRISPVHKMLGTSPVRSPVDNGLSGGTEEQLIDCVVESAFLLAWRGIEGSSKQCWMERGQVLVCVNKLALTNELVASHLEIKRKLFERLLQACCTSLQESEALEDDEQSDTSLANETLNTDDVWSCLIDSNFVIATDTFQEFVDASESELSVCEEASTDEAIVAAVHCSAEVATDDESDGEDDVDPTPEPDFPCKDALEYLAKVKTYWAKNSLSEKSLQYLSFVEDEIVGSAVRKHRQTKITAFFR
ncbi:hypothetical protein HPB51_023255 [Rhipicephalus microplus]|uniref:DUF4704 domain-containing protein n=1 Tax=Rhipicephalus microplus TaxID=6941 RepID=A0A9J6F9W4_RHIMP|nr:hypothetical protein HPB51_023255 [Rhipicephalus microplus]